HWDEFLGLEENQNPHRLTRAELYWLLGTKRVYSRSVWKTTGMGRECNKGFLREQFEPIWHELFGDTPAQHSKIIRLPRHKQRHEGGTECHRLTTRRTKHAPKSSGSTCEAG